MREGKAPAFFAQAWSKLRRFWLVAARPGYVRKSLELREGECRQCGYCCSIAFRCPQYTGDSCAIHGRHYRQCKAFPIDRRDAELIRRLGGECGYSFKSGVPRALPISPHGLSLILASMLVCGVAGVLSAPFIGWWALLFALPAAFVVFFFRDPERFGEESGPDVLLAPADGTVVAIREAPMPISGEPAVMMDIFLSILNVHVNRAPAGGEVVACAYERGKFLNALRGKAGQENENNTLAIACDSGRRVEVKQISGAIARRIVCTVAEGRRVEAGERFGMIRFGSRTQLFAPADSGFEPAVGVGDAVRAGRTLMGRFR